MFLRVLTAFAIGLSAAILLWLFKRLYTLAINYRQAKKLGLPIIICCYNWQYLTFGILRKYLDWVIRLPFGLGIWITFADLGWCFKHAYKPHHELGHAICIVTSKQNEIWIDDPTALSELLTNWKKWHKPPKFYSVLEVFGRNVLTIEGADWQRQRKIINSAFAEQSLATVWQATIKQAGQMLDAAFPDDKAVSLFEAKRAVDTMTMNVLAAGIFGQDLEFTGARQIVAAHHTNSFAETQRWILQELLWVILFGNTKVPDYLCPLLPTKVKEVLATKQEYRQYMQEFTEELQNQGEKQESTSNLITTIIKSNDEARDDKLVATGRRVYMTDAELLSNLFILNFAGFETTASTLSFTISYLAMNPAIQDWLLEEIDSVSQTSNLNSYDEVFPKLHRTIAVMYETLRLRGALHFSFKINPEDQILQLRDREIVVPANTYVGLNMSAAARDPMYWGPDSEEWRPSRWIQHDAETGKETLREAPEGTLFVPWTMGPRICPGKKFSQVEFAGTLVTVLRNHRVEAAAEGGESKEQARERLRKVTGEVATHIVPVLVKPKEASVKFIRR